MVFPCVKFLVFNQKKCFLVGSAPLNPCGLLADQMPLDVFNLKFTNGTIIPISVVNIAYKPLIGHKFKKAPGSEALQWINPEDGKKYFFWKNIYLFINRKIY